MTGPIETPVCYAQDLIPTRATSSIPQYPQTGNSDVISSRCPYPTIVSHRFGDSPRTYLESPLSEPDPINPRVTEGDVLYLHDRVTGFSHKNVMRWCVVTRVVGGRVRVAGRSASRKDGVPIPANVMERFDKDGWVMSSTRSISLADAEAAEDIGKIDDRYFQQIRFFTNEDVL